MVNETALTTALNTAYFAESVSTYVIVMGFALLLSGARFRRSLTLRVLGPAATSWRSTRETPERGLLDELTSASAVPSQFRRPPHRGRWSFLGQVI